MPARLAVIALALVLSSSRPLAQLPTSSSCPATDQSVRDADLRVWRAFHDRDDKTLDRLITDDFIGTDDNGASLTKKDLVSSVQRPEGSTHEETAEKAEDVRIVRVGDMAIISFTRASTLSDTAAGIAWSVTSSAMRVFTCRGSEWKMVARQETIFPNKRRKPAPMSADRLDEYVGRYRFVDSTGKGDIIVTRVGSTLHEAWPREDPTELLPGKYDSFYSRGDGLVETFIRDRSGKVVGILYTLADGQLEAKRIQ